eukprot:scaffold18165_cov51-Phaeocystis_antarctica.AAC.1
MRVAVCSSAIVSGGGAPGSGNVSGGGAPAGSPSAAYASASAMPPSHRHRTYSISAANARKPSPTMVTSVAPPSGPPTGAIDA